MCGLFQVYYARLLNCDLERRNMSKQCYKCELNKVKSGETVCKDCFKYITRRRTTRRCNYCNEQYNVNLLEEYDTYCSSQCFAAAEFGIGTGDGAPQEAQ